MHPTCTWTVLLLVAVLPFTVRSQQAEPPEHCPQDSSTCHCPDGSDCTVPSPGAENYGTCDELPCLNGATCEMRGGYGYVCDCSRGYYGDRCEYAMPCASSPCQNYGICNNLDLKSYECACPADTSGEHCEMSMGDSSSWPWEYCGQTCENGGSCARSPDMLEVCQCPPGYYGRRCEKSYLCPVRCGYDEVCAWSSATTECRGECEGPGYGPGCVQVAGASLPRVWAPTLAALLALLILV